MPLTLKSKLPQGAQLKSKLLSSEAQQREDEEFFRGKSGLEKYVNHPIRRAYESILERPAWALSEGVARVGQWGTDKLSEATGMKKGGFFDRAVEVYSQPEKYAPVGKQTSEFQTRLSRIAYSKSTVQGLMVDMGEAITDVGGLLIQMGLIKKIGAPTPAMGRVGAAATGGLKQLGGQLGRIGLHGFFTSKGGLTDRAKSAVTRIAYNITPYIANATGATGMTARGVDIALNTFLTSPTYKAALDQSGGFNEGFLKVAIPQFVMDVGMAWNTTGLPSAKANKVMVNYYRTRLKEFKLPHKEYRAMMDGFKKTLVSEAGYARISKERGEDVPEGYDEMVDPGKPIPKYKKVNYINRINKAKTQADLDLVKDELETHEKMSKDFTNRLSRKARSLEPSPKSKMGVAKPKSFDEVFKVPGVEETKEDPFAEVDKIAEEAKKPAPKLKPITLKSKATPVPGVGKATTELPPAIGKLKEKVLTVADVQRIEEKLSEIEAERSADGKTGDIFDRILEEGGLKAYAGKKEYEEFKGHTPLRIRRKDGTTPDKMAQQLGFESDTEMYRAMDLAKERRAEVKTTKKEATTLRKELKTPGVKQVIKDEDMRKFNRELGELNDALNMVDSDTRDKMMDKLKIGLKGVKEKWKKQMYKDLLKAHDYTEPEKREAKREAEIRKNFLQSGEEVVPKIKVLSTMKKARVFLGKLSKFKSFHYNSTRASRMFEKLDGYERGENHKFFYDRIDQGRNENLTDYNRNLDDFTDFLKVNRINLNEWYKPQKINDKLKLSSDQKIDLYLGLKDEGKAKHILKGGFIDDKKNIIRIDANDAKDIVNSVDSNQKEMAIVKYLLGWYDNRYGEVAESFKRMTGKTLGKVKNYGGMIRLDRETVDFSEDMAQEIVQRNQQVDMPRMAQVRQEGAVQPIQTGALENFLYYLGRTSHYKTLGPVLQDHERVLKSPDYRQSIVNQRGYNFYKNLLKWNDDMKEYASQKDFGIISGWAKFVRRNSAVSVLGANLLPGGRQAISTLNAIAETESPAAILKGWAQMIGDHKGVEEFVYKRSPQLKFRMVERDMEEIIRAKGTKAIFGKKTKLSEKSMWLIKTIDKATVLSVWKGAYDLELHRTGDEKAAIQRAEDVIRKTQPMADVKDLPAFFKGGELEKMFTMFQNQINNNYNYYTHDIVGKTVAGQLSAKQVATRVVWSYILPSLVMGTVNRGGMAEDLNDIAVDLVTYPISGIMFFGNIINNIIKGYEQALPLPLQILGSAGRLASSQDTEAKIKYGISTLSRLMGIPIGQGMRTLDGAIDLWEGYSDDWRRLIWSEWAMEEQGDRQKQLVPDEYNARIEDLIQEFMPSRPTVLKSKVLKSKLTSKVLKSKLGGRR